MRIAVRQGVFETNSSSSHSFCIKNNTYGDMADYTASVVECLDENGVWDIFAEDFCFGRSPVRLIKTLADKVRYAMCDTGFELEDIEDALKSIVPEFVRFGDTMYDEYSSVFLSSMLRNNGVTLEQFLSSPSFFVVQDGDEYNIFSAINELGILAIDTIDEDYG